MLEERLEFAQELARFAGALLREGYGQPVEVDHKESVTDLVTEFDLRAEELLLENIGKTYPQDAVVGEEGGRRGEGDFTWLLDPLDGTTNFAHGIPFFSVSLACVKDGEPLLGVIYDPMRDELFRALSGGGAWLGEQRLRVSEIRDLDSSVLATGFPYDLRTNPDNNLEHFKELSVLVQAIRRLGSAALDLAYVASGRLDGYWELRSKPWDWAAGHLLVVEAGGRVTRLDGGSNIYAEPLSILATNGRIHARMLQELGRAPRPTE